MNFVRDSLLILWITVQIQCQVRNYTRRRHKCQKPQGDPPTQSPDNSFWPGARVPYAIDSSFDNTDRAQLDIAISDYHNKTCIRWYPRSSESAYVYFTKDLNNNCAASDNCYANSRRTSTYGQCRDAHAMIHEMGHTLCFGHEHARNDRDEYLKPSNCIEGKYDHLNGGHLYDYLSIMHYFCDDRCRVPSMEGVNHCDSTNGLMSVLDAEKLNNMNKCGGCFAYRFQFLNQINSFSNPVEAGRETGGEPLYVCRAYHQGDIIPGKGKINSGECWLPYGGGEHKYTTKFEILANPQNVGLQWVGGGSIPGNAIPAGRTRDGESLYMGRCSVQVNGGTSVIPGKIHKNNPNQMYYSYGGSERTCTNFEILTCS